MISSVERRFDSADTDINFFVLNLMKLSEIPTATTVKCAYSMTDVHQESKSSALGFAIGEIARPGFHLNMGNVYVCNGDGKTTMQLSSQDSARWPTSSVKRLWLSNGHGCVFKRVVSERFFLRIEDILALPSTDLNSFASFAFRYVYEDRFTRINSATIEARFRCFCYFQLVDAAVDDTNAGLLK